MAIKNNSAYQTLTEVDIYSLYSVGPSSRWYAAAPQALIAPEIQYSYCLTRCSIA